MTKETYRKMGLLEDQGSRGVRVHHHHGREAPGMVAGAVVENSHLQQQTESKLKMVQIFKLPPASPYLLNCSNRDTSWELSIQMSESAGD